MLLLRGSYSVAVQLEGAEPMVEFSRLKLNACPVVPLNVRLAFWPGERFPLVGTCVTGPVAPTAGTVSVPVKSEALLTQKVSPLLAIPLTVTTTCPVVAPLGTGTVIEPPAHFVGVAVIPLNVTVLVFCLAAKLFPLIVTGVPTVPWSGVRVLITGAGTVNGTALL
jgi:hypothetical protein